MPGNPFPLSGRLAVIAEGDQRWGGGGGADAGGGGGGGGGAGVKEESGSRQKVRKERAGEMRTDKCGLAERRPLQTAPPGGISRMS